MWNKWQDWEKFEPVLDGGVEGEMEGDRAPGLQQQEEETIAKAITTHKS